MSDSEPDLRSVFSRRAPSERVAQNSLAFAIRDAFPVSPGHTLVVPFREVATWFDATVEEQRALLQLVDTVRKQLDSEFHPDGYNVGFNAGTAAGQTVMHLHVHVIPRFTGDIPDPRGGVRHVIPGRGNYLAAGESSLVTGGTTDPFLAHLKPLFAGANTVFIVAAFARDSGLHLIHGDIREVLLRGGRVRVVTGDYLAITQVTALERLLAWTEIWSEGAEHDTEGSPTGRFAARVVETSRLSPPGTSFHPKSWMFEGPDFGVAYVGSSNLSRSALSDGIEWNLRTDRSIAPGTWTELNRSAEALWQLATPLSGEWLASYEKRASLAMHPLPPGEASEEPEVVFPEPHEIQLEALEALRRTRAEGRTRTLVTMATGLGKTWLTAFDLRAWMAENGRFPRVLFVAHRGEILDQAASTFRRLSRSLDLIPRVSWCVGAGDDVSGDMVFASVQKLSLKKGLESLAKERFDYVVVDEVHHAAAESYRRILDRVTTSFLLGLTATPDRADGADIRGIFDDHLAFEAGLAVGIDAGLLSAFAYLGLRDTVDYAQIPWRNSRFDLAALETAAETEERMNQLWQAWGANAGTRTLVFCCSVRHATYTERWLVAHGVRCRSVTAQTSAPERAGVLAALRGGDLDAICAIDLFNEGLDIPSIDRVVMLRPTESPVLFLQQLGRGLRRREGKDRLIVIDFVGNHRIFLERVRLLLSLGRSPVSLRDYLEGRDTPELPEGCSMRVELEAVEMLRFLLPRGENEVIRAYREMRLVQGRRPTAGELFRAGYLPSSLGGWFVFLQREGDLTEEELAALAQGSDWFERLEKTSITKSFKLVVLEVLMEAEALTTGLPLSELADRSHAFIVRSPELLRDIQNVALLPDPIHPDSGDWLRYWRDNPIHAWIEGRDSRWFAVDEAPGGGARFVCRLPIPDGDVATFSRMTREVVDYRLAQYRRRDTAVVGAFTSKVTWNQRDPILKLPSRTSLPGLPTGDVDVRIPDGSSWRFRFAKEFCNVAWVAGRDRNELPDLLRSWFGPSAGRPGSSFVVRFSPSPDGLWVEPVNANIVLFPNGTEVRAFPSLRAAAGVASQDSFEEESSSEVEEVRLPIAKPGDRLFSVRASGTSMDGGRVPIHDGDWVVMRWARGEALKNVAGKIALVETSELDGASAFQLKRVVREAGRWLLRSDNPDFADIEASERSIPLALHVQTVRPEELAPEVGTMLTESELPQAFGLLQPLHNGRIDGHLFIFVESKESFRTPDRLDHPITRRPGETAFVLARAESGAGWRYCGVGRWQEAEGLWEIHELDWPTWHALGSGRSASRRLPAEDMAEASVLVTRILEIAASDGGRLRRGESVYHVAEGSGRGALQIDGGPGGLKKRAVSLLDIGWVLAAQRDVKQHGGVLDEPRVNRMRYLEGTPKASTRWIDTKHAMFLVAVSGEITRT
ncbi:MAG: DEAD/DEAH box helicase family protein [Thermoanaerobaculia bacterium]